MTAPLASLTVPVIIPRSPCARRPVEVSAKSAAITYILLCIPGSPAAENSGSSTWPFPAVRGLYLKLLVKMGACLRLTPDAKFAGSEGLPNGVWTHPASERVGRGVFAEQSQFLIRGWVLLELAA